MEKNQAIEKGGQRETPPGRDQERRTDQHRRDFQSPGQAIMGGNGRPDENEARDGEKGKLEKYFSPEAGAGG